MHPDDLTSRLRQAIHDRGMSLNSISTTCAIDRGRLSRFMRAERDLTLGAAARLCAVLGLELTVCPDEPTPCTVVPLAAFRAWLAQRIDAHLRQRPRGSLCRLAETVGVMPVSVHRWRVGSHNVAREHLPALLEALGTSLDDLSRELGVERVEVPHVLARGAQSRGLRTPEPGSVRTRNP